MKSPQFQDDGGLALSQLITHENFLNFRVLNGIMFEQVDQYVEVNYEYHRADDLVHAGFEEKSRKFNERDFYPRVFDREQRNGRNVRVDVDLGMLMREAQAKFSDTNSQMLPLLLDRDTRLVSKIMKEKAATLKNVFGDKNYLQFPQGLPGILRFQELSEDEVVMLNDADNRAFAVFSICNK